MRFHNTATLVAPTACPAAPGAEALADLPAQTIVLIDGAPDAAARAGAILACLAQARGETVRIFSTEAAAAALSGVRVQIVALPAAPSHGEDYADAQRDGDARAALYERALVSAAHTSGHRVVIVAAPDAARAPLGVAAFTWRPLGARLTDVIALRVEASARPGIRFKLRRYEDIPSRGAAMRYDGVVEIGETPRAAELRGR